MAPRVGSVSAMGTTWVRAWPVLVALVLLAGCGPDRLPDFPTTPAPLPGEQLVFVLDRGASGFASEQEQTVGGPDLLVYGDGRVIYPTSGENMPGQPTAYTIAWVEPELVARFATEAEQRGVVHEDVDFGEAAVTDQGTTTVSLHGTGGRHAVAVYALDDRFESGLTEGQRRARAALGEVIAEATALPRAAPRTDFPTSLVRVVELRSPGDGGDAGVEWPGLHPATFLRPSRSPTALGCGTVSGVGASDIFAAARVNPDGRWLVDGRIRVLVVSIVLPGMPVC